jgi:glucokinase
MPAKSRLYIGVDVGGTKILAALAEESGMLLARERRRTPRGRTRGPVLEAVEEAITAVLEQAKSRRGRVRAIGVAVPGVVDPDRGCVVVTPNMGLSGARVVARLEKRLGIPTALGNDCNLGTLGEKWLGAARGASSAFGMLVGTGIGGGFVQKNRLWRGYRESASEVGHMVMQVGGPVCGCGNRGCLEALASRTAIERDLRRAVRAGEKTVLVKLLKENLRQIRSGALKEALRRRDALVRRVLRRAAEVLGLACVSIRHLLDPEVIVLGGGVMEACGEFLLPIITRMVEADRLPGARPGGGVVLSPLGDDAVVLGAVALARRRAGRSPFAKRFASSDAYPPVRWAGPGRLRVGGKTYRHDVIIRANGKVKNRKAPGQGRFVVRPDDLARACRGGPDVLFIGTGRRDGTPLDKKARAFLDRRAIACEVLPTPKAAHAYNRSPRRKAALLHVGG